MALAAKKVIQRQLMDSLVPVTPILMAVYQVRITVAQTVDTAVISAAVAVAVEPVVDTAAAVVAAAIQADQVVQAATGDMVRRIIIFKARR